MRPLLKLLPGPLHQGRKPAVEADHQMLSGSFRGRDDRLQVRLTSSEGLLDKDVLARAQRGLRQAGHACRAGWQSLPGSRDHLRGAPGAP